MRTTAKALVLLGSSLALIEGCALPSAFRRAPISREVVNQLEHEVAALKERNRQLEAKGTGAPASAPQPIYTELLQVYADTDVQLWRQGSTTILIFPASLLFSNEDGAIRQEALLPLDLLATALRGHPELQVELIGHTDDTPPAGRTAKVWPTNWEKSFGWARATQRVLVEKFGLDPQRFSLSARSDADPLVTNDTPGGRSSNRRVEVRIVAPVRPPGG